MVRLANKFDIPDILTMLHNYRDCTPVEFFKDYGDDEYVTKILTHIFAGKGLILISYRNNKPAGILVSIIENSIWDPKLSVLRELAYWVEPEFRGTTIGYRLLSKYVELGQQFINNDRVKTLTISKMVNSPNLDYSKLGFNKVEETYSIGI